MEKDTQNIQSRMHIVNFNKHPFIISNLSHAIYNVQVGRKN